MMRLTEFLQSLNEIFHDPAEIEFEGFKLNQASENDEQGSFGDVKNSKVFHYITPPGGKRQVVDHSPYEHINDAGLKVYVEFFKRHNRFPTRKDIKSIGPIHNNDLHEIATL